MYPAFMPRGVKSSRDIRRAVVKECPFPDEDHTLLRIESALGDRRFTACDPDGETRRCKLRGSMRRCRVVPGDLVLAAARSELASEWMDVIGKYAPDEEKHIARSFAMPKSQATVDAADCCEDIVQFEDI
jgi:translation initiation factor IF-1